MTGDRHHARTTKTVLVVMGVLLLAYAAALAVVYTHDLAVAEEYAAFDRARHRIDMQAHDAWARTVGIEDQVRVIQELAPTYGEPEREAWLQKLPGLRAEQRAAEAEHERLDRKEDRMRDHLTTIADKAWYFEPEELEGSF